MPFMREYVNSDENQKLNFLERAKTRMHLVQIFKFAHISTLYQKYTIPLMDKMCRNKSKIYFIVYSNVSNKRTVFNNRKGLQPFQKE